METASGNDGDESWIRPTREQQWKTLSQTATNRFDGLAVALAELPYAEGVNPNLDHFYWIIPFAQRMECEPALHFYYPESHHAVIDLLSEPYDKAEHKNYLTIFAHASDLYEVRATDGKLRPSPDRTDRHLYDEDNAIATLITLCDKLFERREQAEL